MSHDNETITRIVPQPKLSFPSFSEVWKNRELLAVMMESAIRSRYRQSLLGLAWAVIHPLTYMMIFTLVFGRLANIKTGELPYQVYAFAGLLPWQFMSRLITDSTSSLIGTASILSKIYIPRLTVLLTPVASATLDFLIGLLVLLLMMAWFGTVPSWRILSFPLFFTLACMLAISIGLWVSVINVTYRDVSAVLVVVLQVMFYATPIVYPISLAPEKWRTLLWLNPATPIVEGFRFAFLNGPFPDLIPLSICILTILAIAVPGLMVFNRLSQTMIDRI